VQVSLQKFTFGFQEILHGVYWMHHRKHPKYAGSLKVWIEVQRSVEGEKNSMDGGTRNKDVKNWISQEGNSFLLAGKTKVQCCLLESKT
jgi:hypothetical protein